MRSALRIFMCMVVAGPSCLMVLFAISGCERGEQAPSKPLVWGGPKNISMIPIIAAKKGFFKESGLDIRTNNVQTGKIAMDAVVSGDLDFGIIVDTNIAFVEFQEGADIRVIASIAEKYDDAIVARRDQGITMPADLEGKTLGVLFGTTSHRFADLFIEFYGLNRDRIEFVNLAPPGIQAAVISGQIAAGSVWQPFRYNVEHQLGDRAVQFNDKQIYTAYSLVAVRKEFAKNNGDKIRAFLAALIKAEQFIREHRLEAINILAKELKLDKAVLTAIWDEYDLSVKADAALLRVFADEGKWIQRTQKGFEDKPVPSYQDVLDSRFLGAIDRSRVIVSEP